MLQFGFSAFLENTITYMYVWFFLVDISSPLFPLSSTMISMRFCSFCSESAMMIVSSAYRRLFMFTPPTEIPPSLWYCAWSVLCIMRREVWCRAVVFRLFQKTVILPPKPVGFRLTYIQSWDYCKRCYFRVTKFSRLAAPKHIRGLLNSRWADAHLSFWYCTMLTSFNEWYIYIHVCLLGSTKTKQVQGRI